jgi:Flp pilus assembly protein TadD
MIGFALKRAEDFEQAKEYFIKAVELEPKDARPNYNLGMLYTDLGQYELSRKYLEAAVSLGPSVREYTDALFELESVAGAPAVRMEPAVS